MRQTPKTEPAQRQPRRAGFIFVTRPRCKSCGSVALKRMRTSRDDRGEKIHHSACEVCGARWDVYYQ